MDKINFLLEHDVYNIEWVRNILYWTIVSDPMSKNKNIFKFICLRNNIFFIFMNLI